MVGQTSMALNPSNGSNFELLALKGLKFKSLKYSSLGTNAIDLKL